MAKDSLTIDSDPGGYVFYISWRLADGDMGASLGDSGECTQRKLIAARTKAAGSDENAWGSVEHIAATLAVRPLSDGKEQDGRYYWESKTKAQKALRAANVAIKAERALAANRPWPEWAKQAAAAGWKPPKGWKP